LFPEDFKNRRKISCGTFLRKSEQYPQESFWSEWQKFPLPVNDSCKHTACNSAANSSGNSEAKLFQQENPQKSDLFRRKLRRKYSSKDLHIFY